MRYAEVVDAIHARIPQPSYQPYWESRESYEKRVEEYMRAIEGAYRDAGLQVLAEVSSASIPATDESLRSKPASLLTTGETAQALGIAAQTLQNWRFTGRFKDALPFVKIGGAVRYRSEDVERVKREGIVKA